MPNRVIRESILDSERYWSVSQDARQFFFHLMLLADDLGVVSLAPVMLRRRCFDSPPTEKRLDKLLSELVDADLLRIFQVDEVRWGLIPRFRQRLQITKPKFVLPPEAVILDDNWLKNKVNEFRVKDSNPTDGQHRGQHPVQRPESNRILETKRNERVEREKTPCQEAGCANPAVLGQARCLTHELQARKVLESQDEPIP